MSRTSHSSWIVVVIALFVTLGASGLAFGVSTGDHPTSSSSHSGTAGESSSTSQAPVGPTPSNAGLAKALAIENALRAKGISPARIHLPNFAGAVADTREQVRPSYTEAPAPMGVADIGLENRSGVLKPYELNTTSVAGTVNITDLQSLYVDGDGPDTYGIQLNSVANGVTVFGDSSYEYWSQNYVDYTVSTRQLVFGDEVWNFSSPSGYFPQNSVYGFSPNGTFADFPFLYQGYGPAITIGYPFALTLYLNTSTISDRPALYFNYTVSNATFHLSSSFDYLIFNSTVGSPTGRAPVPYYQANGYHYDPIGLINDMEIDLLGNDDGDTTAFLSADATVSLQFWNATAGAMQEVPSALSAGQETGETAVGLLVYSSGGPHPIGLVRAGPGFVQGLWNYSTTSGAEPFTLHLTPANTFLFVNTGTVENVSHAEWVPTAASGTTVFYLPTGGTYYLDFLMSDYDPGSLIEVASAPTPITEHLTPDPTEGIYTPLFALDNAELGAISSSGAGTSVSPYILLSTQYGPLAPQFAQWDDYLFPVFPGLLLAGTSAWVDVTPPSFEIDIPLWEYGPPYVPAPNSGLPLTNDLQLQFYDASNISLVHAVGISGWMSAFLNGFPESSVMWWNCTNSSVIANTFDDQGNALLLYGGTNNTVWGNTFLTTPVAAANQGSIDGEGLWVTGVNETESGDLLYNNEFEVSIPAITPTVDPFPCDQYGICTPTAYVDTWNVSDQPATDYQLVDGWNLTGSIVGTSYQGGNYWSNYGTGLNPFGVLPYNNSGAITVDGDYVPLVPFALYDVTFQETGLGPDLVWNVSANGVTLSLTSPGVLLPPNPWMELPNGTYALSVTGPAGYVVTYAPTEFIVSGASVTVTILFAPLVTVQVKETGLAPGVEWSASINGTGTGNTTVTEYNDTSSISFLVPPGTYNFTAAAPRYTVAPSRTTYTVGPTGGSVSFEFTAFPGYVDIQVTPTSASAVVNGQSVALKNGLLSVSAPPGLATIELTAAGYQPYFTNVTVVSGTYLNFTVVLHAVTSSSSSSSSSTGISTTGWILIALLAALAVAFLLGMVYFARRPGKGAAAPGARAAQPWQEPSPPPPPPPPPPA